MEWLERRELLAGDVVMFNDHVEGASTHSFVTSYAANGQASGLLVDSSTGDATGITLSTSAVSVTFESTAGAPFPGTDADNVFNGWVDFGSGGGTSIALAQNFQGGPDTYTHAFSGLDPNREYEVAGTAVRGNAGYTNRWTLVTLVGADSFNAAHSSGVGIVTSVANPALAANQVALWTGENHQAGQGFVVQWTDVDPGADGQFQLVSEQYEGPTPGVGSGDSSGGPKGYGLAAIRLIELDPSLHVASTDPANGAALSMAPSSYTVNFSLPVDASTVQATDLTVDGMAATAFQVIDSDTVEFTLPLVVEEGFHQIELAEGAIVSTGAGLPLQAHVGSFAILDTSGIVINEINYDSGDDSIPTEYVELFNGSEGSVDLSGWFLDSAVSYVFPQGTSIDAGGYLLISQNPAEVLAEYGAQSIGPFEGRLSNSSDIVVLRDSFGVKQDEVDYQLGFPWPTVGDVPGQSIQLINPGLENDIGGNWRSGPITPGASNSTFALNSAPQMRQVSHSPEAPKPGEDVTITMKVTDPEGVASVVLEYQVVNPGDYIAITDPRYNTQWVSMAMRDDGTGGDAVAGDDVYTGVLAGSLQTHRRLVRYRVRAQDVLGASVLAPYADDGQPNFAYFVYDAIPDWTGAARPGVTPAVTYDSDLLGSVATYHLITTEQAHADAQFIPGTDRNNGYGGSDYLWHGALVYDGVVYDHIRFRARGGVWRYSMGKNMWKFDFNRGHGFEARDDYGNKYQVDWDKLNLSALIQQGDTGFRGEQGLFEAAGFKLFNLAGVASPNTNYVHFRIVESANENGASQFDTDFQGLYLAIEQMDDQFLEQHGLPDGNLYKMENGTGVGGIGGESNNQGDYPQPNDSSDLIQFKNTYENFPTEPASWWEDNLDLEGYYSYRSILEAIHHYDTGFGKNYFYYNNPETETWEVLPWDLDLIWNDNMYGNGAEPFRDRVLAFPQYDLEYRNRMREIIDLLYNSEQTGMLIDEIASFVYTAGEASFVDADRAMWDYNPILTSSYVNGGKAGHGYYYAAGRSSGINDFTPADSFVGVANELKNYVVSRTSFIYNTVLTDEDDIPDTPLVQYNGAAGFPVNDLQFQSSRFTSGESTFGALEWRIAEVTDPNDPGFDASSPRSYEIQPAWESGVVTTFDDEITIPGSAVDPDKLYRVRVRMMDADGRWSHWSNPLQFETSAAVGEATSDLRVTEINYHPHDAMPQFGDLPLDADEFEFIEVTNVGVAAIDLAGVRFVSVDVDGDEQGFDFEFGAATLDPSESIVVVEDLDAFESRYGTSVNVAGQWSGALSNSGERITLLDANGLTIQSFDYSDGGDWPDRPDGVGSSLEVIDVTGDYNVPTNWRASNEFGGTPGAPGTGPVFDVIVNEILSHSDGDALDQVELYNLTAGAIDLSKWYLSDDSGDLFKFRIPDGESVGAGQYLVFNQAQLGFALDGQFGDQLWFVSADPTSGKPVRFADELEYDATYTDVSLGRWSNGDPAANLFPMTDQTIGGPNSGPVLGDLIISEVHYNPDEVPAEYAAVIEESELEFVELYNRSGATAAIGDWTTDAVEFTFPPGSTVTAGEAIVLVSFDPVAQPGKANAFRDIFVVAPGVRIFGPVAGRLDNAGERVKLLAPEDPITLATGDVLIDAVSYSPDAPWPGNADGGGASLNRTAPDAFGDFPSNWVGQTPTPGSVAFNVQTSADFDLNGQVDGSDFLAWQRGFGAPNATMADGDANGDQDVDEQDLTIWEGTFGQTAVLATSVSAAQPEQLSAASAGEDLRITELNYHPHEALLQFGELEVDADEFEFVELTNMGAEEIDLTGARFVSVDVAGDEQGFDFEFGAVSLGPGEAIVVVEDLDAFQSRYGTGVNVAGEWSGGLSNSGERITLLDSGGATIQSFDYSDSGSWPERPDGIGSSLEAMDVNGDYSSATNWRSSNEFGGTPGTPGTGPVFDVIANEILSHSDGDAMDLVELYNLTAGSIDLSKWYLSDDSAELFKFQVPDGTNMGSGQYLVFDQAQLGFALDGQFGDQLWLVASDAATGKPLRFADALEFDATVSNVSLGRWPNNDPAADLFSMTSPTLGGPNSGPVVGGLILSEVHYNPDDVPVEHAAVITQSELEFVEIYNHTTAPVAIGDWQSDAIEFTFSPGTVVAAGEAIVLVTFDPAAEPGKANAFRAIFDVAPGVRLFGAASGQLNNAGERVKLLMPEDPITLATGFVLVDAVEYSPDAPWPTSADGGGSSLNRTDASAFGAFSTSWSAAGPTPGHVSLTSESADFDADGDVDGSDFLAWQNGFGIAAPNATLADGDADGDQEVDKQDLTIWEGGFGAQAAVIVSTKAGATTESLSASTASIESIESPTAGSALTPSLVDFALLARSEGAGTSGEATRSSVAKCADSKQFQSRSPSARSRSSWAPATRFSLAGMDLEELADEEGTAMPGEVDLAIESAFGDGWADQI